MPVRGLICLPGDKSISHRALLLASLTRGDCIIHNLSTGMDVESTRKCLSKCGIKSRKNKSNVRIKGGIFNHPKTVLNCGNSGTTVRLMAGLLSGRGISAKFIGDN